MGRRSAASVLQVVGFSVALLSGSLGMSGTKAIGIQDQEFPGIWGSRNSRSEIPRNFQSFYLLTYLYLEMMSCRANQL